MALSIQGKKTGGDWYFSYSRLHQTVRYAALRVCGAPKFLGLHENGEEIQSFGFYISSYIIVGDNINIKNMMKYQHALLLAGHYFPNILLHSDCDGNYTKNGKIDPFHDKHLMRGNSVQLKKELDMLIEYDYMFQDEERYDFILTHIKIFRDTVITELKEGTGTIIFS